MADSSVILLTRDPAILDPVLSAAAATGHSVHLAEDLPDLARRWSQAAAVIIGADQASTVVDARIPRHRQAYLVGVDQGELVRWSPSLGAATLWLPGAAEQLADVVSAASADHQVAPVIAVVGATGGVGASSLAAGVALEARRPTLLIDGDLGGGGLDLLLGLEGDDGWRWAELAGASGDLGDLTGNLPRLAEVDLVSMARPGAQPPAAALAAVIRAGRRHHELVVIDLGRGRDDWSLEALRLADRTLLVVSADVRAVAAARETLAELGALASDLGVVVRQVRGGLPGELIADELGLTAWGQFPRCPRLAAGTVRGEPPNRASGRAWRRACRRIAEAIT